MMMFGYLVNGKRLSLKTAAGQTERMRKHGRNMSTRRRRRKMMDEYEYEVEFDRAVNFTLMPRLVGNKGFVSREEIREILHTLHTEFNLTLSFGELN